MDRKELDMILHEGEGYKIELKEGVGNLEKDLVAFANSSGGKIFLGVTDEGKIKGRLWDFIGTLDRITLTKDESREIK